MAEAPHWHYDPSSNSLSGRKSQVKALEGPPYQESKPKDYRLPDGELRRSVPPSNREDEGAATAITARSSLPSALCAMPEWSGTIDDESTAATVSEAG